MMLADVTGIETDLDLLWVLVATALVMLMQVGFLCLESGLVRAKNSINVATKNLVDFCLSGLIFMLLGFGLMFGTSMGGWLGGSHFFYSEMGDGRLAAFMLFQLVFCGTAATIISGVMAERVRFSGYLIVTAIVSALIYPVFGHWAWGGALADTGSGWLAGLGFIDFAGSTVVHSIGAWTALAVVIIIGPRLGQFSEEGRPIQGHNLVLAALGTLILWFAWFGFNGGSTLALNSSVPGILLNTNLAACAGGMSALILSRTFARQWDLPAVLNGCIAGLVAITAGCHLFGPGLSIGIGAAAGVVSCGGIYLLRRMKIDDAIGGVSAHGFAGALGTLAVALADPGLFGTGLTRLQQFGVQLTGVLTAFLWAFLVAFLLLSLINRLRPLRVPADEEHMGLNVSEHNASSELLDLLTAMDAQQRTGDFSQKVAVEPHTEVGQIAQQFNRVLTRVAAEINEHKETNSHYRRAKDLAERASAVKNEFLANMSHEIRTPMNGVLGMLGILVQSHPPLSQEQQMLANVASDSAEDLLTIINDILDFSKIEAGQMELESIPFSLAEVIENVLQLLGGKAHDKGLELLTWIYHDVPATVVGDPTRLRQVLLNLVANAIKFTERGEITVRVSKAHETEDRSIIHIAVDDTGIGIAPEIIPQLFTPFQQADGSTTRRFGGTGLGLAISRQLVELMHGRIGVESRMGKGSSFWLSVPLQKFAGDAIEPMAAAMPMHLPKVLVVDDSLAVQNTMRHMLEEWQIQPALASSAFQAMELLRAQMEAKQPFDIVLIDYRMPEMDGLQLCQWMMADPQLAQTRRLLFSAYSSEITQTDREACGISGVIDKPVRQQQLWQAVFPGQTPTDARASGQKSAEREAVPLNLPKADRISAKLLMIWPWR